MICVSKLGVTKNTLCHSERSEESAVRFALSRRTGDERFDWLPPIFSKIFPCGIHTFNQGDLLSSRPSFELCLASDAIVDVFKYLVINETINSIAASEFNFPRSVLENTMNQGIGHADVDAT